MSRLGLGTSRFHYLREPDAAGLVDAALAAGITHFDTARLYGDGFAEKVLGAALAGRRSGVTIATKFGLEPSRLIEAAGPFATPLRGARSILRRIGVMGGPRRRWTAAALDISLAASLRALRTDHVDILLMHEPHAAEIEKADEVVAALSRVKAQGRARFVGIAAHMVDVEVALARYGGAIDVVQTLESEWRDGGILPDLTFGALAGGPQIYGAAKPSAATVHEAVRVALARRPAGCLLVGSTKAEHVRELAALASGDGRR